MRWFTQGEGRYAFLLIILLVLAAIATVRTVSHIESQIYSLEYGQAVDRLQDYLAFEQRKLADLTQYVAGSREYSGSVEEYLGHVSHAGSLASLDVLAVGMLSPDGRLLGIRFTTEEVGAEEVIEPDSFLTWAESVPADSEEFAVQVGFVGTSHGPALMALGQVRSETSPELLYLFVVRPLNRKYVRKIQETYPAFGGLADPGKQPAEGGFLVPISDLAGRKVGAFVLYLDLDWVARVGRSLTVTIHVLTMGFLFLAGAMGLWAVRSSATIEGLRRVGRFVDAMDYLQDGLLVLDKKGHVTGSNPAARQMVGEERASKTHVHEVFPVLAKEDVRTLLDPRRPRELERTVTDGDEPAIWRFRSQPSHDIDLVLISDVTNEKFMEMRQRQESTLQLIGRIARGVAHDFNNILCAVSGHAALLGMMATLTSEDKESLDAIVEESKRGAELAAHLLQLSRTSTGEHPTSQLVEHVEKAAELLRVGLSSQWEVECSGEQRFPTVPLSAVQIEQAVLNLGLAVADELGGPGVVHLDLGQPGTGAVADVEPEFAAVVVVSASETETGVVPPSSRTHMEEEMGVIQSVVRTMLEEVGGRLDILLVAGRRVYRLCLPEFVLDEAASSLVHVPMEVAAYISSWKVLVGTDREEFAQELMEKFEPLGTRATWTKDIVTTLSCVENEEGFQSLLVDKQVLGAEADGLVRAILKLQPDAGLVVLCGSSEEESDSLKEDVVFCSPDADPDTVIEAMLKARELSKRGKEV